MNFINNKFVNKVLKLFSYKPSSSYSFILPDSNSDTNPNENIAQMKSEENIFSSINVNLEYMKVKYNTLINSDVNIREFTLLAQDKEYTAFLFYIDGMVNSELINDFILKPLMLKNKSNTSQNKQVVSKAIASNISVKRIKKVSLEDYIYNSLIPQNSLEKLKKFKEIVSDINAGNCLLFIDTLDIAFSIQVKGFKSRSISNPSNEMVIRGSQEAFVEILRTNTSILRRLVNNENLIIEKASAGKISNTNIAICYMKNIANSDLVAEVKYRINNLAVDSVLSSGQLEQLIQDDGNVFFPQVISTERPDKACAYLLEGRVVVIVNGNPYVLIMPGVLVDYMSSPEDFNLKFQFANLLKFIRAIAFVITLLLPSFYVAITNYHQELIPSELLFAIAASREAVPFPVIFEILLMEISFELIREAGLRVPSPIGPTLGIIGALILGEAAVSANIVSPILIIIVALTGICSFAIPDYSLGFSLRILRFIFIILGYAGGFLGLSLGMFLQFIILSNLSSFGVPYLVPYFPPTSDRRKYFEKPIWKKEHRLDFLNTKKPKAQKQVSMQWKKN